MSNKNQNFEKAIERARKGEFREYWLQLYIRDNYKKLGFDSLEGPFETGYDFKGVYKGQKVVVEAERTPRDFVLHKHNPKEVGVLIVLADDDTDRSLLPKKIIKVDPVDFVESTHEMRKDYALEKQKERELFLHILPFLKIKKAFATLWDLLREETPYEGTPEAEAFEEALGVTAIEYLKSSGLNYEELKTKTDKHTMIVTLIEALARDLIKSRRDVNDFTDEEIEHLEKWLGVLGREYGSRI